ncbi:MAG: TlpA family protein disulfide reductase [Halobacteriales archaeon]
MPTQDDRVTRRSVLGLGAGAITTALAGCLSGGGTEATSPTATATDGMVSTDTPPTTEIATAAAASWREVELTDVQTGDTFTISQFEGRPVLLQFFAVWCPKCTKQQKFLRDLTDRRDEVVVVSLNTDPNENADRVRSHLEEYDGFDWRYAIAPTDVTESLIDESGSVIATPPAVPILRMCPNGDTTLVDGRGTKSADELATAIEQC